MKTPHIVHKVYLHKVYLPPRALIQKLAPALLMASLAGGAACSSSMNPSKSGGSGGAKTGAGGRTGSTGVGGSTVGPPPGIGGFTGGPTGAGGSTGPVVVQKLCATKTTVMNPVLINFETYDGMVTADKFGTAFGGAAANTGTAYMGPYAYGDGSVTPTLSVLAGHPPSNWAVAETAVQARTWGMGGGFWMSSCTNASAYKGVSFWVRGSGPLNVFSFSLSMDSTTPPDPANPAGGGICTGAAATCTPPTKADIPLTQDWTQVQILWSDFAPGMNGATAVIPNGDNIVGLGWSVPLMFQLDPSAAGDAAGPYVAVVGDLLINIDDVAFIP
jgi:hypothetical protein